MRAFSPLRDDLVIKEQTVGQKVTYIIKDPVRQVYFRFEEEEFFVLKNLDGRKTPQDIAKQYNERFHDNLEANEIVEFIYTVKRNDLFERTLIEQNVFYYEQLIEKRKSLIKHAKGSVLYFRIPVIDPDGFLNRMIPYIRFMWFRPVIYFCLCFMLSSVCLLFMNSEKLKIGMAHIFDFVNQDVTSIFTLWATIMIVIAIHELGHAFTCKRYGGECHEIGFLFMFFSPCMYANVNDAWLFENKTHRLYVTFAGCYIEFLVGGAAVYVWLFTQTGAILNLLAFKVVIVCFFSAIFMNFNPLMKYDGYFALSDYVEIPNLRSRSRDYISYLLKKNVLRLASEYEALTAREKIILAVYGLLSSIYMVNVISGLVYMIGHMLYQYFNVVGLLFSVFVLYKLFGHYLRRSFNLVRLVMTEHKSLFKKPIVRLSIVTCISFVIWMIFFLPLPNRFEVPCVLEPEKELYLRALAGGYVEALPKDGMSYKKGEVIVNMTDDQLTERLKRIEIYSQENRLLQNASLAYDNRAEHARLVKIQQKYDDELKELKNEIENLTIFAPFEGVITEKLDYVEHRFLRKGQYIGTLIDPTSYRASVDILERDFEGISEDMPARLTLNIRPWIVIDGIVTHIAPLNQKKGLARFYKVTVTFPNEDLFLKGGLKGTLFLNIGKHTLSRRFVKWLKKTIRLDLQM